MAQRTDWPANPATREVGLWPYPVRIFTLGQSRVLVHGQALHFSGKAQRRPMRLLHALLARGGRPVAVNLLRRALGDDGDDEGVGEVGGGSCSRGAFDMALSRLRHLLGVPGVLRLGDDQLALDDSLCWVDAWACENQLLRVGRELRPMRGPNQAPDRGRALLERALALYQGEFLEGEETAWALLARERLQARLLRVARQLGEDFEAAGRWAEAGSLYARLREQFPLDENLCLHLIRSHVRRDQMVQARGLYSRCRELMARVLGVLPGAEIRALLEMGR